MANRSGNAIAAAGAQRDAITFPHRLGEAPHAILRSVVFDYAAIHKHEAMDRKRQQWQLKGCSSIAFRQHA